MYVLMNTFNNCEISRHRTLQTAAKGLLKYTKAFRRNNSSNSYTTTEVYKIVDGKLVELSAQDDDLFADFYYRLSM